MTTWDLASESDKQAIRLLVEQVRRAGKPLPPLPNSAGDPDLVGLTKRDAGSLITLLRDSIKMWA